jgi:hypothetical protein
MKLNIPTIKVYLISPGTGKYQPRVHTVFERLVNQGYTNIEFVRSIPDPIGTNSLTRTVLDILKKELSGDRPFIIVEDDCQVYFNTSTIECPDDADAVYLGVAKWIYPHSYTTLGQGLHIRPNTATDCPDVHPQVTRILGMTGGHAILFLNREYIRKFMTCMEPLLAKTIPHDLVFATLQPSHNIYALKQPMYYQDASLGGQEDVTRLVYNGSHYI